jgi:outer membrane biosynthesis protein TonB
MVSFAVSLLPPQLSGLAAGCAGAQRPPETTGSVEAHGVQPAAAPGPADASGPTTTTMLGDGGDAAGVKLAPPATDPGQDSTAHKGPHTHEPGRTPADIRAIVVAHRDEARSCYDRQLAGHPGIEGDLVIQWTIDPKGNVTQVSSDTSRSQILEAGVVACVSDVIKKIQFAPSPGGFETKAFYPFNFHPRRNQAGGTP